MCSIFTICTRPFYRHLPLQPDSRLFRMTHSPTRANPPSDKLDLPPEVNGWANKITWADTFTRELPGDKVLPHSPFTQPAEESKVRMSRTVNDAMWSWAVPAIHENPRLVSVSPQGARLIGLSLDAVKQAPLVWSGNERLPGSLPWAHCYGGHQFGVWAGQLGDGRAVSLGEVVVDERRWEIQLKGAGRTPYSRFGDGFAVRRSSVREYLVAEHLCSLGVPTTRSLSLVFTDRLVMREGLEYGAIASRLAPSWVRFGSFEYPASHGNIGLTRQLADYIIKYHFPNILQDEAKETDGWNRYAILFSNIMKKTAKMVAHWQSIGFCHGVMNTDNMSVLGLTIDYGPFAFLDAYDPDFICNHSDPEGRYAFNEQPRVALWNLLRLASSFSLLIDQVKNPVDALGNKTYEPSQATVDIIKQILNSFAHEYKNQYVVLMRRKFGLFNLAKNTDTDLVIEPFLALLRKAKSDYTFALRSLCDVPEIISHKEPFAPGGPIEQHIDRLVERSQLPCDVDSWKQEVLEYYRSVFVPRILEDAGHALDKPDFATVGEKMKQVNPKYVLRNWVAQDIIDRVEEDENCIDQALELLTTHAFSDSVPDHLRDLAEKYASPVPGWGQGLQCSCSS
ncbi:hypothetical protein EDC05_005605 [Coemansia umbellata]|uniref:Selenoprotein O n=1 Tax=Coemansia umbellata TaxID=1424467 RepID=A0ABQ8PF34_9FUNG|nr:hypothetical protein EDC05_005605 [Coemansia umbellata]